MCGSWKCAYANSLLAKSFKLLIAFCCCFRLIFDLGRKKMLKKGCIYLFIKKIYSGDSSDIDLRLSINDDNKKLIFNIYIFKINKEQILLL